MNKEMEEFVILHQKKLIKLLNTVKESVVINLDETIDDEETVDRVLEQYDQHLDNFIEEYLTIMNNI